ncbi:MAG: DUF5675 family protein [Bacteroidota bacterium]
MKLENIEVLRNLSLKEKSRDWMYQSAKKNKLNLVLFGIIMLIGLLCPVQSKAQNFPVRSTVQLLPPHPLNLSGYSDLSANGIQATLILNEAGRLQYAVKLRITIEGQDIFMQTKSTYQPPPIFLDGNIPMTLLGSDLAGYFNPRNFNISGGSAELVRRGGNLPEGLYTFTVEVLDFNRNIVVSNTGQARAWLILNDPPILNQPANTKKVNINGDVQNIFFQWTPRHTASPNAAFNVRYIFELFEILPKGRNPNDIALTTSPIYSNVLFGNSLVYGPGEPQLFRGTDYAWRVKAIDDSGKDLFKNDGFSEVFSFTYGDACQVPDGITATAVSHKLLRFQWNQGIEQDSYEVQLKKADADEDSWRSFPTETAEREVSFVEAETTYSYRVLGVCGNSKSAPSEEQTVTTPAVEEFACGNEEVPFVPLSDDPANYLGYGSVITAASFEVFVTSAVRNPDGTFTGTGLVELPFLKAMRVGAVFRNIGVNKEYQLISGMIETTHQPVETVMNLDSLGGDDGDGGVDIISAVEEATGADTVIVVGLDIDSIYVDDDNNVVVVDPDGIEQVVGQVGVDTDGDGEPDVDSVAVVDEDGDTYVATADGVTNAGNFSGSGPGSTQTAPGGTENRFNIIAKFLVDEQSGTYAYGFDSPPDDESYNHYERSEINEDTYKAAWRSVETGRVAYIRSGYKPEGEERLNVVYKSEDFGTVSHTPATAGSNDEEGAFYDQLLVQGRSHESVECIYAMAQDGEGESLYEEAIGRVNVVSYDEKRIDLAIVPINGAQVNLGNLEAELNKIFGQAVVKFNPIQFKTNVDVPDWDKNDDKLFNAETNAGFRTAEMNAVRKAVKAQHGIDKHTYYVFLIPHPPKQSGRVGIMRRKSQFAYIFSKGQSTEKLIKTIAHELGHGIFHLEHTWKDPALIGPGQLRSANLMDYDEVGAGNLGLDLLYPQWQDIHNPAWVIGLFESDEDAALDEDAAIYYDGEKLKRFLTQIKKNNKSLWNGDLLLKNGKTPEAIISNKDLQDDVFVRNYYENFSVDMSNFLNGVIDFYPNDQGIQRVLEKHKNDPVYDNESLPYNQEKILLAYKVPVDFDDDGLLITPGESFTITMHGYSVTNSIISHYAQKIVEPDVVTYIFYNGLSPKRGVKNPGEGNVVSNRKALSFTVPKLESVFFEQFLNLRGLINFNVIDPDKLKDEIKIVVTRRQSNRYITSGMIKVEGTDIEGVTLELGKGTFQESNSPCSDERRLKLACKRVPKGIYNAELNRTANSGQGQHVYRSIRIKDGQNNSNRTGVLIHRGTNQSFTEGCILAMYSKDLNQIKLNPEKFMDGKKMGYNSIVQASEAFVLSLYNKIDELNPENKKKIVVEIRDEDSDNSLNIESPTFELRRISGEYYFSLNVKEKANELIDELPKKLVERLLEDLNIIEVIEDEIKKIEGLIKNGQNVTKDEKAKRLKDLWDSEIQKANSELTSDNALAKFKLNEDFINELKTWLGTKINHQNKNQIINRIIENQSSAPLAYYYLTDNNTTKGRIMVSTKLRNMLDRDISNIIEETKLKFTR